MQQDPIITPILIGVGITGSISIGSASIGIASVISAALTTTALVGASLLLVDRPKMPTPSSGTVAFQQGIPPAISGVGLARLAGARLFNEERNGNLYRINGLANHRIAGIEGYYLGEDAVTLGEDGITVDGLSDGRYAGGVVKVWSGLGGPCPLGAENPLQAIIDDFPGILTEQFRPHGVAVLGTRFGGVSINDFTRYYPGGAVEPSVAARLALVWDPRDPAQDPEDDSTWAWSANPVLIAIWYHCFCLHGEMQDYRTAILPYLDHLAHEADLCDEPVAQDGGGSAPRFECHFWWQMTMDRDTVWATIKASCDGWREVLPDGGLAFWVGVDREPVVWIDDDDIAGFEMHAGVLDSDLVTILSVKYSDPQSAYQAVEADSFRDEDAISLYGEKTASPDLWQIQNLKQARTIGWRIFNRANPILLGTLFGNLGLERVRGYPWVGIRSTRFPLLDGKKLEREDSLQTDLSRASTTFGFRVLDWDAMATVPSEGVRHTAPERPTSDVLPVPSIIAAAPELVTLTGGQTGVRIDVRVADLDRDDLGLVLLWSRDTSDDWEHTPYPALADDPAGGEYTVSTGMLSVDATYVVTVASLGTGGSWGTPAPAVYISTSSDTIAPASPVIRSATGGAGSATLAVRAPTSANLAAVRLWRALTGDPFSAASLVEAVDDPALGALLTITDTIAAGTYDYWATAENGASYSSTPAGPVTVTVT